MIPQRTLWAADLRFDSDDGFAVRREQVADCKANVLSSLGEDGLHYPVLDLDFTAYTVPSSTPGHVHLYLERGMTWDQFERLLYALRDAGLVENEAERAAANLKEMF